MSTEPVTPTAMAMTALRSSCHDAKAASEALRQGGPGGPCDGSAEPEEYL